MPVLEVDSFCNTENAENMQEECHCNLKPPLKLKKEKLKRKKGEKRHKSKISSKAVGVLAQMATGLSVSRATS